MPTQKLGRLLGMTMMLLALFAGAAAGAGLSDAGNLATLEFEWH
ncbi:hypothetical protein [Micromonospora mirobrigensis]|uniref:Uncharacterized protein n=1 Tax=Micromonospora mirobrigensis TaxID=262898 RepID=A0A1C4Y8Q3_9ACTN|nr:hypothetical protein [Micromonospora mirobrigensis]SCF17050.1 hypothetical protein GA0070564_103625 [Micromonospora mirobrigensis]